VGGSPEPLAYETGLRSEMGDRGSDRRQAELNYDPVKGKVAVPWICWGPYFWADGVKGRKDGLTLLRSDYRESDGLHPSAAGLSKFVKLMLDFFKTDATARLWFNQ